MSEPIERMGRVMARVALIGLVVVLLLLLLATSAYGQHCATHAGPNMTIAVPETVDFDWQQGDTLRAYGQTSGVCGAERTPTGDGFTLAVKGYQIVAGQDTLQGLSSGEPIQIRLVRDGSEVPLSAVTEVGSLVYQTDTWAILSALEPPADSHPGVTLSPRTATVRPAGDRWSVPMQVAFTGTDTLEAIEAALNGPVDTTLTSSGTYTLTEARPDTLRVALFGMGARNLTEPFVLSGPARPGTVSLASGSAVVVTDTRDTVEVSLSMAPLTVQPITAGDVDGDGTVALTDVLRIWNAKYAQTEAPLTPAETQRGDLTGDGRVTLIDMLKIFFLINAGRR